MTRSRALEPPARARGSRAAPAGGATTEHSFSTRVETLALVLAVVGALIGVAAGLLTLRDPSPLSGNRSIGMVAALSSLGVSVLTALGVLRFTTPRTQPWMRTVPWWRRIPMLLGTSLMLGGLALLLTSAMYAVMQQAFRGLALDRGASTFWVAATTAIWTYATVSITATLTSGGLSSLLAVFLISGIFAAALTSPNPYWWEKYFSDLGAQPGTSGLAFNLTLLLTGLALVAVAEFIAHDIAVWARRTEEPRWKVRMIRIVVWVLGGLVALVALIPMNVNREVHDAAAQSLVLVFAVATVLFPTLLRRMPGGLNAITVVALGLLLTLAVLFKPVRYLNMTAFELGAGAIVYTWLMLLVRIVSAAAHEDRVTEGDSVPA